MLYNKGDWEKQMGIKIDDTGQRPFSSNVTLRFHWQTGIDLNERNYSALPHKQGFIREKGIGKREKE